MLSQRAVLYARVSSDDRDKDGRNLAGQLQMCREHAQAKGWRIVAELAEDDRGASGASFDLPQLTRAQEMARQGEFDVLVVREIDRFARSLVKQLLVEEELHHAGVTIEYVLGEYPDTPEGRMMKHVKATIAEYEREKINERMSRGRKLAVKAGSVLVAGRPPFGYSVEQDDRGRRLLVVNEEEAAIVREIFSLYTEGDRDGNRLSLRALAKRLTASSVPTYSQFRNGDPAHRQKLRHGSWNSSTVRDMLRNETYIGIWRYGKTVRTNGKRTHNPGSSDVYAEVPPIVSRERWDAAQARLTQNKRDAKRNVKHEYLLGRRLKCAACGSAMYGTTRTVKQRRYSYYRCCAAARAEHYFHTCDASSFKGKDVDDIVWGWVRLLLADPEALALGLHMQEEARERHSAPLQRQLKHVHAQLTKLEQKSDRLLDLYLEGALDKAVWSQRTTRLKQDLEKLSHERQELVARLNQDRVSEEQLDTLQRFAERIGHGIHAIEDDFEAKRRIVDMLDVQVSLGLDQDSHKTANVTCTFGASDLSIVTETSPRFTRQNDRCTRNREQPKFDCGYLPDTGLDVRTENLRT